MAVVLNSKLVNVLYVGQFQRLDNSASNSGDGTAENTTALNSLAGKVFSPNTGVFELRQMAILHTENNPVGRISGTNDRSVNDNYRDDRVSINGGSEQQFDSLVTVNITVSYRLTPGGTVQSVTGRYMMIQMEDGGLYFVSNAEGGAAPALLDNRGSIISITVNSVADTDAAGDELIYNDGSIIGTVVAPNGIVDGTSGNDVIGAGYVDAHTDAIDNSDSIVNVPAGGAAGTNDDLVYGYGGNDNISAGAGNDTVYGGDGNDVLYGGDGNDVLYGDDGNDQLFGGANDDILNGGNGNDVLNGDAGNDVLNGDAGNDQLFGGDNDDLLNGGANDDILNGGIGNDTLNGDDGNDVLNGDAGNDRLFGGIGNDQLFGGDNDDHLNGGANDDILNGGNGNDTLRGDDGNDVLNGEAGDDLLLGGANDDTLNGGIGNDYLIGNDGDDILNGDAGNDVLEGVNGNDLLDGGLGDDSLIGGIGNDNIFGGEGNDTVYGGEGNDSILGDANDDDLIGDLGNDTIFGGTGNDSIWGDEGADSLHGDDGDDYIDGGADNDIITGGAGNDLVDGGDGDDSIDGDAGNDEIYGDAGNDLIYGGADNDLLYGGDGNDQINGDAGNDEVYGDDGDDVIFGDEDPSGTGNDLLYGGAGNDHMEGDGGDDSVEGGIGNDALFGGSGNDTLKGDDGDDSIAGEEGDDQLFGGEGNDNLDGDLGNDTLTAGGGVDTLTGGGGDDLFIISGGPSDTITITDFGAGETNGNNDNPSDNDFMDLTTWYNASTVAAYNSANGTTFKSGLQILKHDAIDGTLDYIAAQGGPTVHVTGVSPSLLDAEHTGVTCFAKGTVIETLRGAVAVEELTRGDLVRTIDNGYQPIRWIGARKIDAEELAVSPMLYPVRIKAGALGSGLPLRDLLVSQQHRVLISSKIAMRMFGEASVLTAAKNLLEVSGVDIANDMSAVEFFHFMFDQHQIVLSEGMPTESFYTGEMAIKMLTDETREELFAIFPELRHYDPAQPPVAARPIVPGRLGRKMVSRHLKNGVDLTDANAVASLEIV